MDRPACSLPSPVSVRGLEAEPPLFLAPMAGLTHSALRTLVAELGGCGLLSTEMLSARSLPHENLLKSSWLVRSVEERPLSFQVLVSGPDIIAPAFEKLHEAGADAIDINLGCRAPKVIRRGAGHALSRDPARLEQVVREARRRTDLPLTAKIRLGRRPDDPETCELARLLEDCGIDMLHVHARLASEGFSRPPRWREVAGIKGAVSVPVIANGGIRSAEDAARCLEVSGADGLMIGRAAAEAPWIFRDIALALSGGTESPLPHPDMPALYRRFFSLLQERFPPEKRLGRLKEFTHYFSRNYKFGHQLAWKVQAAKSMAEALERAESFFERNRHGE